MAANDCVNCKGSCHNPNALEYQKCFKKEHNNGCGCDCQNSVDGCDDLVDDNTTVVRQRKTRSDFCCF